MPRIVVTIIWSIMVLIGVGIIVWAPGQSAPVASRLLVRNTLLLSGDVSNPGLTGRYVIAKGGIEPRKPLRPVDVADQPVLLEAAGAKLMLSLPVSQTSVTTGLNAGSKVQLCGKSPFSYGSVTVQAVRCELGSPNTPCTALVDLPASAAGNVGAKALKDETSTKELRLSATCN